jgi:hypothetical protein
LVLLIKLGEGGKVNTYINIFRLVYWKTVDVFLESQASPASCRDGIGVT